MGFSAMADRVVWAPSSSRDRKWPLVTKCTHSRVVLSHIRRQSCYYYYFGDGDYTIRSAVPENPMLHANLMAVCFIEPELLPIEILHCRNRDFRRLFAPVTLTLPRWPSYTNYALDPYSVEIYWMCEKELRTSKLSQVIVWQTYVHSLYTDRQTDRHRRNYIPVPCRFAGGQ